MGITGGQTTRLMACEHTATSPAAPNWIGCVHDSDDSSVQAMSGATDEAIEIIVQHVEALHNSTTPPSSEDYCDLVATAIGGAPNAAAIIAIAEVEDDANYVVLTGWRKYPATQPPAVVVLREAQAEPL